MAMIFLVFLISIVLLFGAATVRNMLMFGAGAAALLVGITALGVTTGWPAWVVFSMAIVPIASLLGYTALSQFSDKRDLKRKMSELRLQQERYRKLSEELPLQTTRLQETAQQSLRDRE